MQSLSSSFLEDGLPHGNPLRDTVRIADDPEMRMVLQSIGAMAPRPPLHVHGRDGSGIGATSSASSSTGNEASTNEQEKPYGEKQPDA